MNTHQATYEKALEGFERRMTERETAMADRIASSRGGRPSSCRASRRRRHCHNHHSGCSLTHPSPPLADGRRDDREGRSGTTNVSWLGMQRACASESGPVGAGRTTPEDAGTVTPPIVFPSGQVAVRMRGSRAPQNVFQCDGPISVEQHHEITLMTSVSIRTLATGFTFEFQAGMLPKTVGNCGLQGWCSDVVAEGTGPAGGSIFLFEIPVMAR